MTSVSAVRALTLIVGVAALGCAPRRPPEQSLVPPQDVEMDAKVLRKFYEEIREYAELRKAALKTVPPVGPGATAEQIAAHQKAMTTAIREYRKGARQGDMFKPPVEAAIRRILTKELAGPEGAAVLKEIRQGNPTVEGTPKRSNPTQEVKPPVVVQVNAVYPEAAPFSSVPPSLLLKLPQLPDVVRYRFVGRDLILRDTEANVILDFIKNIVPDPSIPR
jgi:hypothetical protein